MLLAISSHALDVDGAANDARNPESPWHITADDVSFSDEAKLYIAQGNVLITKLDRRLSADYVRFNHKTMEAFARGNVVLISGEDILVGDSMDIDLEAEVGTVNNGTIFLSDNHFYIKGDKIEKTGKNTYQAEKASITSCDSELPAWKLTGRKLKVTIEGYGHIVNGAMWAKGVPVAYVPFMVFPAKTKRQTGFLVPEAGYSSRHWEFFNQPFFWAINDQMDATFYLHHMQRRGEKFGGEFRYAATAESKGTVMADFMRDRKKESADDPSRAVNVNATSDWGYVETGTDILRESSDRYWYRMKADQELPFDVMAKLDIDVVSDQDYLREFRAGYSGYEATESYFNRNFGREIDEYDDSVRTNKLNLTKGWSKFNLNAEAKWYDDVVKRNKGTQSTVLQTLPYVGFNGSKQAIFDSPLYFDLDSDYRHFYQEELKDGHRLDFYPRFYVPMKLGSYLSFEPSVGLRETVWYTERYEGSTIATDEYLSRQMADLKLDFSSGLYKVFDFDNLGVEKIKHGLTPRVVYSYLPHQDQDKFPSFDSVDRISEKNTVTYSLTNTFTSRSIKNKAALSGESDESQKPDYSYNQFLYFKLEQSYDIDEENEDVAARWADGEHKRPFSTILGEAEFKPGKYIGFKGDGTWSTYEDTMMTRNAAVRIWDPRDDMVEVEHRYTRNSSESIKFLGEFNLVGAVSVYGEHERNLHIDNDIIWGGGVIFRSQCWSVDFSYTDEKEGDRKWMVKFDLFGLGSIGESKKRNSLSSYF